MSNHASCRRVALGRRAVAPVRGGAIAGRLVEEGRRQPIAGARVVASWHPSSGGAPSGPAVLGEAVTDARGAFRVRFADAETEARFLASREQAFVLRVERGRALSHDSEVFTRKRPLPVPLALRLRPSTAPIPWPEVAARAEAAGIERIGELARALVSVPDGRSPFGDWDVAVRHAVFGALEGAFLDPGGVLARVQAPPVLHALRSGRARAAYAARIGDGAAPEVRSALALLLAKADAFSELSAVDWPFDPQALAAGDPAVALLKYQGSYQQGSSTTTGAGGGVPPVFVPKASDASRYRDYLRNLYTGAPGQEGFGTRLARLRGRFHQNFQTLNVTDQPANEILIGIVREILTADTGEDYGFGFASAALPARGTLGARDYLDALLALTHLSRREFGLRYRLDCERSDGVLSTPVQENVFALQRFYADGFQSASDPFPVFPPRLQGRAPFFLQYDEWLERNAPFHGENVLPLRATLFVDMPPAERQVIRERGAEPGEENGAVAWLARVLDLEDALSAAHVSFDQGEYVIARAGYEQAAELARGALWKFPGANPEGIVAALASRLDACRDLPLESEEDVAEWLELLQILHVEDLAEGVQSNWSEFTAWLDAHRLEIAFAVLHAYAWTIPCWQADTALQLGDFSTAMELYGRITRFLVARANASDRPGSPDYQNLFGDTPFLPSEFFHTDGPLPYTADTSAHAARDYPFDFYGSSVAEKLSRSVMGDIHPTLLRLFKLRHGAAVLEWADGLYRRGDAVAVARARELYKAVLFLHKASPKVSPHWDADSLPVPEWMGPLTGGQVGFVSAAENPARISQKDRARLGLAQMAAGLNYYGYADDLVPALRYPPLKEAADRLASAARGAQEDLLAFTATLEQSLQDGLADQNLLQKAVLQGAIAGEQRAVAEFGVTLAERQVAEVQKALEQTQERIEEEDGLGAQFADFFEGFGKAIAGLAPAMGAAGGAAGAGAGEAALAGSGFTYTSSAATAAAGGGLVLGGFALFVYASYTSMAAMIEERTNLRKLRTLLRDDLLPLAKEQVRVAQRGVVIADLQARIAQADAQLALALMRFQSERFLSLELWSSVLAVVRRALRRYLDLGARYAWLAERALAFEQDRSLDVVRTDYFPRRLQGVTGADLLQADLAELDAARIDGVRRSVPVKHTVSLAFDHPLALLQLKQTGRCLFLTQEATLRGAHPGTYGHRVRAATVTVKSPNSTVGARGTLLNAGGSLVSRSDGSSRVLLREADALPSRSSSCARTSRSTACRARRSWRSRAAGSRPSGSWRCPRPRTRTASTRSRTCSSPSTCARSSRPRCGCSTSASPRRRRCASCCTPRTPSRRQAWPRCAIPESRWRRWPSTWRPSRCRRATLPASCGTSSSSWRAPPGRPAPRSCARTRRRWSSPARSRAASRCPTRRRASTAARPR